MQDNSLPPQQDTQIPIPVRKSVTPFTWIKRTIFVLIGIVCLFGVWSSLSPYLPTNNQSVSKNSPSLGVTWKTYTNKKFNYSVKYPDNLEMSQESQYSTVYQIKDRTHIGFPLLYISVIPDGFDKKNEIYNFMSETEIKIFYAIHDNETKQIQTGDNAQYFSYQRLASLPVSGINGVMIENKKVWQGEDGVINRRVFVKKGGNTYILGSYYFTQQDLNDFHDFLLSFKFD